MGRRSAKTISTTTTGYLYDGMDFVQELAGTTSTSSVRANLITGGLDEPLLRITGTGSAATLSHFFSDANNNVIALTDSTQAIATKYSYGAYGQSKQTTVSGATNTNSQQYTGRENDGTGLMYYRARYYHVGCARFISEDPIGWASGQTNGYAYVGGDPISFTDPTGNFGIAGALIGFGVDVVIQLAMNGGNLSCVSWGQAGLAGALGAIGGGALGGAFKHSVSGKRWADAAHNWGAVSSRYRRAQGIERGSGIEVHHWLIEQKSPIGKLVPDSIKNHPWNLRPMNKDFHKFIHHELDPITRTIAGAPGYAQGIAGGIGVAVAGGGGSGCD